MTWRFLHAADIHLDSPMLNLERYEGAPIDSFREATRRAVENLVELAVREQARFVLIAGDLYDGDCRDINTAIALRKQLVELDRNGIQAFIVQGNHDAASKVTKAFRIEPPEGTRLLSTKRPETVLLDDLPVAIHGQGFPTAAVDDNLAASYPGAAPGRLNIGLLHTNCGGAKGHDNYAPSSVQSLRAKGYDYWALGHVHQHQVIHRGDPWIVYPGNLQGRSIRETGPKGCYVVTVEGGRIAGLEHESLDTVRWGRCAVDASACADGDAVVATVAEALQEEVARAGDRLLAARVDIHGASAAHGDLSLNPLYWQQRLRDLAVDRFTERVWLEKIRFKTSAAIDLESVDALDDALGELLRDIRDLDSLDVALAEVGSELEDMRSTLPTDPRLPGGAMPDLSDPEVHTEVLNDVKALLTSRLLQRKVTT